MTMTERDLEKDPEKDLEKDDKEEESNKDDKLTTPTTIAKDDHEDRKTEALDSSSNNLINRKRLQLKQSLNRTCSSIIESIKSIF